MQNNKNTLHKRFSSGQHLTRTESHIDLEDEKLSIASEGSSNPSSQGGSTVNSPDSDLESEISDTEYQDAKSQKISTKSIETAPVTQGKLKINIKKQFHALRIDGLASSHTPLSEHEFLSPVIPQTYDFDEGFGKEFEESSPDSISQQACIPSLRENDLVPVSQPQREKSHSLFDACIVNDYLTISHVLPNLLQTQKETQLKELSSKVREEELMCSIKLSSPTVLKVPEAEKPKFSISAQLDTNYLTKETTPDMKVEVNDTQQAQRSDSAKNKKDVSAMMKFGLTNVSLNGVQKERRTSINSHLINEDYLINEDGENRRYTL